MPQYHSRSRDPSRIIENIFENVPFTKSRSPFHEGGNGSISLFPIIVFIVLAINIALIYRAIKDEQRKGNSSSKNSSSKNDKQCRMGDNETNLFCVTCLYEYENDMVKSKSNNALQAVFHPTSIWDRNSIIKISYRYHGLDCPAYKKFLMETLQNEVFPYTSQISFEFVDRFEDGDIRIEVFLNRPNRGAGESAPGSRGAKARPRDQATMILYGPVNANVIIHEFLHGLGFDHGHIHDDAIPNEPAITAYVESRGRTVDYNDLRSLHPLSHRIRSFGNPDENSIMNYSFPRCWEVNGELQPLFTSRETREPLHLRAGDVLSDLDIEGLIALYGTMEDLRNFRSNKNTRRRSFKAGNKFDIQNCFFH